jgi:hypothetical protein
VLHGPAAEALLCSVASTEATIMKTITLLAAASVLSLASAVPGLLLTPAQAQARPTGSALPPPALHDPGTRAVAPANAATAAQPAAAAALPAMRDNPRDARGDTPPEVTVRQRGEDTVQEYRRNGQVYMVVITPKSGIAQTYMVDAQGRLVDEHGQKPVRPVMYKVLEWGKSAPATTSTSAAPADAGH